MKKEEILVQTGSLLSLVESDLPEFPCWISPGVLPKGGMLVLGAEAKAGKSMVMLELQRALSTGTVPFDCPRLSVDKPIKTLMVEQELGEYGLAKRVKQLYGNEDPKVFGNNAFYLSKMPEMQLDSREGRDILVRAIDQVQPNVLFLDPIGRMHSYEENSNDQIQQLISNLDQIIKLYRGTDMSMIISHHFGKRSQDPNNARDRLDPYNLRGSSKWFDCPDTLVTVSKGKKLDKPYKAWNINMRWEIRQDEGLPDMHLTVNRDNDLRVRFENELGGDPDPVKKKPENIVEMPKKQLRFARG